MARSVESIAADSIFFLPLERHRVTIGRGPDVVVERGLEGADAGQRGVKLVEKPDAGDVGRVVRGEEGVVVLHGPEHWLVHDLRAGNALRHHGLEAHRRDAVEPAELLLDEADGGAVVGEGCRAFFRRGIPERDGVWAIGRSDALHAALRQNLLGRHLEQAELERGAPDIGDEDFVFGGHGSYRIAWITWRRRVFRRGTCRV